MRVLLALDGSPSSDTARDLVASLDWPSGTVVRLFGVTERVPNLLGSLSPFVFAAGDYATAAAALVDRLSAAAAHIRRPDRVVQTRQAHGRPADWLVDEAIEWDADLVVIGSRGLGRVGSIVLGSVSAEVLDRVPCPVLVARAPSVGTVLLAADGSPAARTAVEHLRVARHLVAHRIEVLSVSGSSGRPLPRTTPASPDARRGSIADVWSEERQRAELTAAMAAQELRRGGFDVRWSVAEGEPAAEIAHAARALGCDLVVLGSHARTGLGRIVSGSISRDVLRHTGASVLVIRETVPRIPGGRRARVVVPRWTPALSWSA